MKIEKISLEKTGVFSSLFLDYLQENAALKPFYNIYPRIEAFDSFLKQRAFPASNRAVLVNVLQSQYQCFDQSEKLRANIEKLTSEKTFTVTTGHQLNLFAGPLYFIYKIVSAINTAKALQKRYPDYSFVPVYWMASEDHDFEEINHFSLFGKEYKWETKQKGAVGKFNLNGIQNVLNELPDKVPLFEAAYMHQPDLSASTRYFVNELFGKEGLVVLDPDHPKLKSLFSYVIKEELEHQPSFDSVKETSEKLEQLNYNTQIHSREINLFYLDNQVRERIVKKDEKYYVLGQKLEFSKSEILRLAEEQPEKFSPNVVLRPLYQEVILPNVAYIGGPAEVAYWLQLKGVFDHYKVSFPSLMPRNFAMVVNHPNYKKLNKLRIKHEQLFLDFHELKKLLVEIHSEKELELAREKEVLEQIFESVKHKAKATDPTLEGYVTSECIKFLKNLEHIEKKIQKAEEKNLEVLIRQLENMKEKLFPGGTLQERKDNFLNFYLKDPQFIQKLIQTFDVFDFSFYFLLEDEEG